MEERKKELNEEEEKKKEGDKTNVILHSQLRFYVCVHSDKVH